MKKSYTKPDIIFESFSLSTDIAGGCTFIVPTPRDADCGYEYDPVTMIFVDGNPGCDLKVEDGEYDGLCYHVPTADRMLFNS